MNFYVFLSAQVSCSDDYSTVDLIFSLEKSKLLRTPTFVLEVTTGVTVALMAYERYIAICQPFDYEIILSNRNRKSIYSILVMFYAMLLFLYGINYLFITVVRGNQPKTFFTKKPNKSLKD